MFLNLCWETQRQIFNEGGEGSQRKGGGKSQARGAFASAASAHNITRGSTNTASMEISIRSTDTMLQPEQVTSLTTASGHSSVDQQVMDQFTQIKTMVTMLSSFLGQKQETTTCAAFCNYLSSEVEGIEEKDFQTFKNKAVKLLSNIQSRAKECGRQPQQQTLSRSSSATSTYVPRKF